MKTSTNWVTAADLKSNYISIERGETVYIMYMGIERLFGFFEAFTDKGTVRLIGGKELDAQDAIIENIINV